MKLKKIKTVSVLEFVPPHPLMLMKRSKDLQYIDTPESVGLSVGRTVPYLND